MFFAQIQERQSADVNTVIQLIQAGECQHLNRGVL